MYNATGTLHYTIDDVVGYKLFVKLDDPNIAAYYRSLIPTYKCVTSQRYPPHISVVRYETPARLENWGKYESNKIMFQYSNVIHYGKVYFWLNAFSKQLEDIRLELGLSLESITRPPCSYKKVFHITIGNIKGQINV